MVEGKPLSLTPSVSIECRTDDSGQGGVEFTDVIPKSPSGKILRRLLRDRDREARRAKGARL